MARILEEVTSPSPLVLVNSTNKNPMSAPSGPNPRRPAPSTGASRELGPEGRRSSNFAAV